MILVIFGILFTRQALFVTGKIGLAKSIVLCVGFATQHVLQIFMVIITKCFGFFLFTLMYNRPRNQIVME